MPGIIVAAPDSCAKNLTDKIFIETSAVPLPAPLDFHTDMQFHYLGDGCAVVCPELFDYYTQRLSGYGIKIICGGTPLKSTYPEDIAYNVARVSKKFALHLARKTDNVLKNELCRRGVTIINVPQGYTKCSVAPVAENAFITSDKGIYDAVSEYKMDVLLISEGNIELKPYPFGFIGGCCGLVSENQMFFDGDLSTHPDGERIVRFLEKYGASPIEVKGKNLRDTGSVICVQ